MFDELQCSRIALCFLSLLLSATAIQWDIAVTVEASLDLLLKNNSTIRRIKFSEKLLAFAYDDSSNTAYFSTSKGTNSSIYSLDLNEHDNEPAHLLTRANGSHISAMSFDAESSSLFWTDFQQQSIMKSRILEAGLLENSVEVHRLDQRVPRGIALDVCNRYVYWTSNYKKKSEGTTGGTIERSNLDGSSVTVIKTNSYEPIGLTIDYEDQKLYWVDDKEGIHYTIERSNLDGSDHEIVFEGKNHQPVFISTNSDNIYWTDYTTNAIWTMSKTLKTEPQSFKSYLNEEVMPISLFTRKPTVCHNILDIDNIEKKSQPENLAYEISPPIKIRNSENCSMNGYYNESSNACNCQLGFSGRKCEISPCLNYCFEGECTVGNNGYPRCHCSEAYDGLRCEHDKCNGYCLNEGNCYIENGQPRCRCKYLNTTRCEKSGVDFLQFCAVLCMSEHSKLNQTYDELCRCFEKEPVLRKVIRFSTLLDYNVIVPFLAALIVILSVIVGVLSYYVNKLKRRPRIKRRYVVNRTGVTPLTSRPQISGEQCEITIENCCNMNICETPCFEPKLRNTMPTTLKKDEKNSLLDNMENNIF